MGLPIRIAISRVRVTEFMRRILHRAVSITGNHFIDCYSERVLRGAYIVRQSSLVRLDDLRRANVDGTWRHRRLLVQ